MSMKKILMTAVAVSALSAGAANAAKLSQTLSTISAVNLLKTSGSTTTYEAYTIANETNAPGTATAVLTFTPSVTGIAAGSYVVTWNVTGGTFGTVTSVAGVDGIGAQVCTISSATTTSVAALCTSTGAVTSFTLTVPIALGTAKAPVAISGSIKTQAGLDIDGGAITGGTVIDYRSGMKAAATPVDATLSLASGFKKFFDTADIANDVIATGFGLVPNNSALAALASDVVYLAPTNALDAADIAAITSAASVTVAGALTSFAPVLGTATTGGGAADYAFTNAQSPASAGTGNMTVTGLNLAGIAAGTAVVGLKQASALVSVAGTQSGYTASIVPTVTAGYTAQSYAPVALGTVSYEGVSFLAPWVGDGSNGITYTIRIGNRGVDALPYATATLLNPTTADTTGTATDGICNLGAVPASGELLVTSSTLATCFGAFKRSDVTITIGAGAAAGAVTAKMRASAAGIVSDVTLGGGATVATAN